LPGVSSPINYDWNLHIDVSTAITLVSWKPVGSVVFGVELTQAPFPQHPTSMTKLGAANTRIQVSLVSIFLCIGFLTVI